MTERHIFSQSLPQNSISISAQGTGPQSEPETRALTGLGAELTGRLLWYVSLHAYGQSWLTPWGYKTKPADNMEQLTQVANDAFREVQKISNS